MYKRITDSQHINKYA